MTDTVNYELDWDFPKKNIYIVTPRFSMLKPYTNDLRNSGLYRSTQAKPFVPDVSIKTSVAKHLQEKFKLASFLQKPYPSGLMLSKQMINPTRFMHSLYQGLYKFIGKNCKNIIVMTMVISI